MSYARIARRTSQATLVVVPIRQPQLQTAAGVARCDRLVTTALTFDLANATAQLRSQTLRVARQLSADNRYDRAHRDAAVCVAAGHGGVACSPLLLILNDGLLQGGSTTGGQSSWSYLVPDGVASITAHYPAGNTTPGDRHSLPSMTVTAQVVNNVAAWSTHQAGQSSPDIVRWQNASGQIIRTIHR